MTDVQTHHITLEMDKLRDAKDQQTRNQVSLCGFQVMSIRSISIYVHVCVCVQVSMWICMYDFY